MSIEKAGTGGMRSDATKKEREKETSTLYKVECAGNKKSRSGML